MAKKLPVEVHLPDVSLGSVDSSLEYQVKLMDSTGPELGTLHSKYHPEKGVLGFRGALSVILSPKEASLLSLPPLPWSGSLVRIIMERKQI